MGTDYGKRVDVSRGLTRFFFSGILLLMDKKYTKREARELFGVKTDYQLAKVFGVSRQAMYAAREDDELSEARQWQIRALLAEKRSGQDSA